MTVAVSHVHDYRPTLDRRIDECAMHHCPERYRVQPQPIRVIAYRETSRAAYRAVTPTRAGTVRGRVRDAIAGSADGATCDEIERATGLAHQTASPAVHWLARQRAIRDSGRRRPTVRRRSAIVWVAANWPP